MRQRYELLDFSTHMPIRCTMQHIGHIEPHLHDFFEVILILSGQCRFTSDGQLSTLGPEDVAAVNSHTPHELHSADCVLISVQFRQSMFGRPSPCPSTPSLSATAPSRATAPPLPPSAGSSPAWSRTTPTSSRAMSCATGA